MRRVLSSLLACLAGLTVPAAYAVEDGNGLPLLEPGELRVVPSFESCSYYFRPEKGGAFRVEYRAAGETAWLAAHAPVCDQPEKIYKGSLFGLREDAAYQLRVRMENAMEPALASACFRTWSSAPPVAMTVDLSQMPDVSENGIVITGQGAPDGWIKYTAPTGFIVRRAPRANDNQPAAIVLKGARYIILENLAVEGGERHAVLVEDCDSVRILNCDLSGWGRTGVQQFDNTKARGKYMDASGQLINLDGGVQIRRSAGTVVERCYIHDPRGRANSWMFSHPAGPEAVVVDHAKGGTVLRWNDMVGSDEHRWNDVIECNSNSSPEGGFHRDSDIAGNFLAFGNDDGVELEGGGMNVRFTRNKIEGTLCGVSFGPCLVGPQFAIGNLIANPGDEAGLALMFFKNSHRLEQRGKRFIYNNTLHGFGPSAGAFGAYGGGAAVMRNNIFVCNDARQPGDWARAEDFDHDLFWVNRARSPSDKFTAAWRGYGQEKHALAADPRLADPAAGDYRPAAHSPARGRAVEVPGVVPAGTDMGAFFGGIADLPVRPLALTARPAQVNFASGGAAVVSVSLPTDAPASVAFQIRKNNVFDWFDVAPASGTVGPGETLQLTVTTDAARLTGRPLFRGAFLVRTANGLSRPVSVYAKGRFTEDARPATAPNSVYIEAGEAASGAQIDIPEDGTYALLARASLEGDWGQKREFDVSVDGAHATGSVAVTPDYQWNFNQGSERVLWLHSLGPISAGKHRVVVRPSGVEFNIAEYIITDNPSVFFVQDWVLKR
ncbi:right-handed parallel beta-helix repeat-containing protein [Termitidicoccus mucosus]|uniref:MSP domain-containing protein n=1 Tax=Termitidicoccus mucosus TaxID=1184151 RepID=A0A178IDM2_9BACT|nr:hypothetical protein AW736_18575 [Opitutaceae bacterium TSB47]